MACGGRGDCFYIDSAKGLQSVSPSTRTPAERDFEPSGRLQGTLRLVAQQQATKKKFRATASDADSIGTAGTPADSLAVRLTAEGVKTDIYVWSRQKGALHGSYMAGSQDPNREARKSG